LNNNTNRNTEYLKARIVLGLNAANKFALYTFWRYQKKESFVSLYPVCRVYVKVCLIEGKHTKHIKSS